MVPPIFSTRHFPRAGHLAARLLVTSALAGLPATAMAQVVRWDGSESSDWGGSGNWNNGTGPTETSSVEIDDPTLDNQPEVGAGQEFTVRNVTVGASAGGSLRVTGGGILNLGEPVNGGSLNIAGAASGGTGGSGDVTVTGAGSQLLVQSSMRIGHTLGGEGVLRIADGGLVRGATLCLACGLPSSAGTGLIEVTGGGSRLELTSTAAGVRIGNVNAGGGAGQLRILDGGKVTAAAGVGGTLGIGSTIEVRGVDSSGNASHFEIGTTLNIRGDVIVADGGHFEMTGPSGATVFHGTSSLTLSGGGRMDVLSINGLSFNQQAEVLITGAGTELNLAGPLAIGANIAGDPVEDFVIADGAVVNVNAAGQSILAQGVERKLIVDNATLNMTGGLRMNRGNLEATDATVDFGSGVVSLGTGVDGNTLTLVNTDFTAGEIATSSGVNTINVGGTEGGPAGGVGTFDLDLFRLNESSELVLNHTGGALDIGSDFTGNGVIRHIAGNTIFSGSDAACCSPFSGQTLVTGGTLTIDGVHGDNSHSMNVSGGATLGGSGIIGGDVTIADATLAPGNSPGMLTIGGDLTLGSASILDFELGSPTGTAGVDSDLIEVGGNLILDGTLNVTDAGGFGAGLYRLANYGGTLTDNGLDIGNVPAGFDEAGFTLQTETAGQVNLLAAEPDRDFIFWDGANSAANGAIDGGTGTWTVDSTNWTVDDGSANGAYDPEDFLIFSGPVEFGGNEQAVAPLGRIAAVANPSNSAGTVTIDNSAGAVSIANGIQFAIDGYTIDGDALTLAPGNIAVRVGDGTAGGAGFVATIKAPITGDGRLVKTDLGTLILSGANDYTGGTFVNAGRLQGDTISLRGDFSVSGTLTFDQQSGGGFAGVIEGSGLIEKEAAGVLTLTGGSGLFEGTTDINAGALMLEGVLGGTIRVNDAARLGGTGRGGDVRVAAGGTVAPGNSVGTLNVAGIAFDAGSIYAVELNDGGNAAGVNNDLIASSGPASIAGGTVHVTPENGTDNGSTYAPGTVYTILTAESGGESDGVDGAFDAVTDDFAFLDFLLSYDSSNVFLTSQLVKTSFCLPGMTFNQCSTGEGAFSIGGGALFDAILPLSDAEAPAALDQLSGELHASLVTAFLDDSRFPREAALRRGAAAGEGGGAWMQGYGSWGHRDGDGNAARLDRDIAGAFLGGDMALGGTARIGLFAGYGRSSFDIDARNSSASADSLHLGAYGGGRWGGLGLGVGGAIAWHDVKTARLPVFSGFSDRLTGKHDARTSQIFGELSYRLDLARGHIEPFARIAWADFHGDALVEDGGPAALSVQKRGDDATFTLLGLRGEAGFGIGGQPAQLTLSAGWRHASGDRLPLSTRSFAGGDDFSIAGLALVRDAFALDLGGGSALSDRAMLSVSYSGQFGSGLSDHGAKANLSIRF